MAERVPFADTRANLIERAARFAAEHGVDRLSVAAIARSAGINRTTAYYYFADRESLIDAVRSWTVDQISNCLAQARGYDGPVAVISFVLRNSGLIKTFIGDMFSSGSLRDKFSGWDRMVSAAAGAAPPSWVAAEGDTEVPGTVMLIGLLAAPLVLATGDPSKQGIEDVTERFRNAFRQLPSPIGPNAERHIG